MYLVKYQNQRRQRTRALSLVLLIALFIGGCNIGQDDANKRIQPVYDRETGKLTLLKYDSKGDGKPDTFSYMDGVVVVRIEIDQDGDGRIDRWEYYGAGQKLERVGFSRHNRGGVDARAQRASATRVSPGRDGV